MSFHIVLHLLTTFWQMSVISQYLEDLLGTCTFLQSLLRFSISVQRCLVSNMAMSIVVVYLLVLFITCIQLYVSYINILVQEYHAIVDIFRIQLFSIILFNLVGPHHCYNIYFNTFISCITFNFISSNRIILQSSLTSSTSAFHMLVHHCSNSFLKIDSHILMHYSSFSFPLSLKYQFLVHYFQFSFLLQHLFRDFFYYIHSQRPSQV